MEISTIKLKGMRFECREGTMDEYVCREVIGGTYKALEVKPGDIVLDIGANIGVFSVMAARAGAAVYAYEPSAENCAQAKRNFHLNDVCHSVLLDFVAVVGNNDKSRNFYLNLKKNSGGHSLYVKRGRREVTVDAVEINSIIEAKRPNKIKIDAEGAELEIINAVLPSNWSSIQKLIFEYHFSILKDKDKSKYFSLIETLKKYFPNITYNPAPGKNWTTIVYASK